MIPVGMDIGVQIGLLRFFSNQSYVVMVQKWNIKNRMIGVGSGAQKKEGKMTKIICTIILGNYILYSPDK